MRIMAEPAPAEVRLRRMIEGYVPLWFLTNQRLSPDLSDAPDRGAGKAAPRRRWPRRRGSSCSGCATSVVEKYVTSRRMQGDPRAIAQVIWVTRARDRVADDRKPYFDWVDRDELVRIQLNPVRGLFRS